MDEWKVPGIDLKVCTRCGACAEACPARAVAMGPSGPAFVDPASCTYCALCETICPEGAIRVDYVIVWDAGGAASA
jgi:4Fe-4S ferredoxin